MTSAVPLRNMETLTYFPELGCIWHIFGKFGSFQALQHWQQQVAANKLSLVNSDVDSYLNIRICQKEPKIAKFSKNVPTAP